jgi:hypothetical protein
MASAVSNYSSFYKKNSDTPNAGDDADATEVSAVETPLTADAKRKAKKKALQNRFASLKSRTDPSGTTNTSR